MRDVHTRPRRRRRSSGATGGFVAVDLADYGLPELSSIGDGPIPPLMLEVCERAANDFRRWERQVARTGNCSRPIRLKGRVARANAGTGELEAVYSTDDQPNGELLVA
ncbi:MAG: replication initiator, partial [Actinomycetota bacterium]